MAIVQLKLKNSVMNSNLDFTAGMFVNGILVKTSQDIAKDIDMAIDDFHARSAVKKRKDTARRVSISPDIIELDIKTQKNISSLIGGTISKFLYNHCGWNIFTKSNGVLFVIS